MTPEERSRIVQALPGYDLGAELGRGAFGVVLGGVHRQLGREVAIKQLPASFSANPDVRSRFLAEAQVLATLNHPHVVPVYDYVEHGDLCLLVMEKLAGGTLWSRFTAKGVTPHAACAVVLATCAGLDHAHGHGVLHRDIKPENLLFATDGVVKVADFGIAKVLTGSQAMATRAGDILGTPAYMAPEQALGQEVGPAADVYACGVMLYELLSGRLPFSEDGGPLAIVYRHVNEDPTPISTVATTLSTPVAEVVMTAIARDPARRFETAEGFAVALGEAATATWTPGWLDAADLPVLATRAIMNSTTRPAGGVAPASPPHATIPHGTVGGATSAVGESLLVRPQVSQHVQGGGAGDVDVRELVPVREAIEPAPFPLVHVLVALAAIVAAAALAFAGPAPTWDEAPPPGFLGVADVDPGTGAVPEVDLAEPFEVAVLPASPAADTIEVGLSLLGVPLSTTARAEVEGSDGARAATIDLSGARFVAASEVAADVTLLDGDAEVATYGFGVRSRQQPWLTVPGVLVAVVVLLAVAYAESFLRNLRRGKRRVGGMIGVVLAGAGIGVGLMGVAWLVASRIPGPASGAATVVLGGLAGLAAGLAALRTSRRRRILLRLR